MLYVRQEASNLHASNNQGKKQDTRNNNQIKTKFQNQKFQTSLFGHLRFDY